MVLVPGAAPCAFEAEAADGHARLHPTAITFRADQANHTWHRVRPCEPTVCRREPGELTRADGPRGGGGALTTRESQKGELLRLAR